MLFILGWASLLIFALIVLLSALPELVKEIDEEILEKHRKPVPPEPVELRRVK